MAEQSYGDWIRSNPPLPTKRYKKEHMAQQTEQKTAVEWLIQELLGFGLLDADDGLNSGLFKKAREMDKQQHVQTWNVAHQAGRFEGKGIAEENWQTFEQYYNETYKK